MCFIMHVGSEVIVNQNELSFREGYPTILNNLMSFFDSIPNLVMVDCSNDGWYSDAMKMRMAFAD